MRRRYLNREAFWHSSRILLPLVSPVTPSRGKFCWDDRNMRHPQDAHVTISAELSARNRPAADCITKAGWVDYESSIKIIGTRFDDLGPPPIIIRCSARYLTPWNFSCLRLKSFSWEIETSSESKKLSESTVEINFQPFSTTRLILGVTNKTKQEEVTQWEWNARSFRLVWSGSESSQTREPSDSELFWYINDEAVPGPRGIFVKMSASSSLHSNCIPT